VPIELERLSGEVLHVRASGKLHKSDYEELSPAVEGLIEASGRIRILLEMDDFHGWDAGAMWEDLKFDLKHFRDIERLAMLGDQAWEKGMAAFCAPFTRAEIRYFDRADAEQARAWIAA